MNTSALIDGIAARGKNDAPDDYIVDGLRHCAICHAPKQARINFFGREKIVYILCECGKSEQRLEEEKKKRQQADELRELAFPAKNMWSYRFEVSDNARHIETARKYVLKWEAVMKNGSGLVFWGNTGTGKSYAAACIANALTDDLVPVRFFRAADLVSDMTDRTTRQKIMQTVCTVPLVILDDLGAERETVFSKEQICSFIDARIEAGKPLICTTNYSLADMQNAQEKADARIFSRLLGVCVPVRVAGTDRRANQGKERLEAFKKLLDGGDG